MKGNDAWRAVAELAASQHGAFHKDQAAEQNLTSRRLLSAVARGTLWRPLSDVFVFVSHPRSFEQRCMIGTLAGGVVSHDSAARLHDFDGFSERGDQPVHISFERDHKRDLGSEFVVHTWRRTSLNDIDRVEGIRCTSIARSLSQIGLNHDRTVVEAALDSMLRKGAPERWVRETLERLRRPGPTGQCVLEEILKDPARCGALSESLLERIVERALGDPRLPTPVRQHRIELDSGERRVDLAFPEAKLAIEGHSRSVHFGRIAEDDDNLRDLELAAAGWEVLYITWAMAHQPELFIQHVIKTHAARLRLLGAA